MKNTMRLMLNLFAVIGCVCIVGCIAVDEEAELSHSNQGKGDNNNSIDPCGYIPYEGKCEREESEDGKGEYKILKWCETTEENEKILHTTICAEGQLCGFNSKYSFLACMVPGIEGYQPFEKESSNTNTSSNQNSFKLHVIPALNLSLGQGYEGYELPDSLFSGKLLPTQCVDGGLGSFKKEASDLVNRTNFKTGEGPMAGAVNLKEDDFQTYLPKALPDSIGPFITAAASDAETILTSTNLCSSQGNTFYLENAKRIADATPCGDGFVSSLSTWRFAGFTLKLVFSSNTLYKEFISEFLSDSDDITSLFQASDETISAASAFLTENKVKLGIVAIQGSGDTEKMQSILNSSTCSLSDMESLKACGETLKDLKVEWQKFCANPPTESDQTLEKLDQDYWGIYSYTLGNYEYLE